MLVLALFVILVLTMLGGAIVQLLLSSSQSVITEVYGARAKHAADAGIQQLARSAFVLNSAPQQCNQTLASPSSFQQIPGWQNCQYQARCVTTEISDGDDDYYYYQFTSAGTCVIDANIVQRKISVEALQQR